MTPAQQLRDEAQRLIAKAKRMEAEDRKKRMAGVKPAVVVAAVSDATGVPEASVTVHDRNLANEKLRAIGGRGRSGATQTPLDAARLIVAVACSRNVKDSADTVRANTDLIAEVEAAIRGDAAPAERYEVRYGNLIMGFVGDAIGPLVKLFSA